MLSLMALLLNYKGTSGGSLLTLPEPAARQLLK